MLILGRKCEETIKIETKSGEIIWIKTLTADKGRVRLGFTADKDIKINRTEVLEDKNDNNN